MSDYDVNGDEYASLRNKVGDHGGGSSPSDSFDGRDSRRKVFVLLLAISYFALIKFGFLHLLVEIRYSSGRIQSSN